MIYGTTIGDEMLAHSHPAIWGNPMWDAVDVKAGGVMPGEAQLLYGLVRALRPERILEIGTSHGYSTLHLAAGCRDNGLGYVSTVEIDSDRQLSATGNIMDAGLMPYVAFFKEVPTGKKFDFIFFDAGHRIEDILGYLDALGDSLEKAVIVIHDAEYDNHHAARVAGIMKRPYIVLDSSAMGLAILARGEQCQ